MMWTMKMLTDIVAIALIANWITWWFTPLEPLREKIVEKAVNKIVSCGAYWAQPLITVFTCPKCLSFWVALIYMQNFLAALITAVVAQLLMYILKKTQNVEP